VSALTVIIDHLPQSVSQVEYNHPQLHPRRSPQGNSSRVHQSHLIFLIKEDNILISSAIVILINQLSILMIIPRTLRMDNLV